MLELEEIIERSQAAKLRKRSLREYLCSRRWFQFTLRTFIIFLTLVCIGIALTINWIIPSEMQWRAANVIEATGGTYAFDNDELDLEIIYPNHPLDLSPVYKVSKSPSTKYSWYHHYLKNINAVFFHGTRENYSSFDWQGLPKLKKLIVDDHTGTWPSDSVLQHAKNLRQLQILKMASVSPTDEGLKALAQLEKIESLTLEFSFMSERGFDELAKLKNLKSLVVIATSNNLDPERIWKWSKLTNVRSLKINTTCFSAKNLQEVFLMPKLERLDLAGARIYSHRYLHYLFHQFDNFNSNFKPPVKEKAKKDWQTAEFDLQNILQLQNLQVLKLSSLMKYKLAPEVIEQLKQRGVTIDYEK